jgi:hypothetical protein
MGMLLADLKEGYGALQAEEDEALILSSSVSVGPTFCSTRGSAMAVDKVTSHDELLKGLDRLKARSTFCHQDVAIKQYMRCSPSVH